MGSENKNLNFLFWRGDTQWGGLLNAEDVEMHVCAKLSKFRAKFVFFSEKLVKIGNIFMFLEPSGKVLQI